MQHEENLDHIIASLFIMGFEGDSFSEKNPVAGWLDNQLGGTIAFDKDYYHYLSTKEWRQKNIKNPEQLAALNADIEKRNSSAFRTIDVEGGVGRYKKDGKTFCEGVTRLNPDLGFAKTLSARQMGELYEAGDVQAVKDNCGRVAKTIKDAGFNLTFGPVVDINLNKDCPVIGKLARSFSPKVETVNACAKIFIDECRKQGVQCVLKHFPGHGSSTVDSHKGMTDITNTWKEVELKPYEELAEYCGMVMTAHVIHEGVDDKPAGISTKWIQKLRDLGFDGVIITDDVQMDGLVHFTQGDSETEDPEKILHNSILAALQAGTDMLIIGNNLKAFNPKRFQECVAFVKKCIEDGRLSKDAILKSYERVCALKKSRHQL